MKVYRRNDDKQLNIHSRKSIVGLFVPIATELENESDYFKSVIEQYKDEKLQPNEIYYKEHEEKCDLLAKMQPQIYASQIVKKVMKLPNGKELVLEQVKAIPYRLSYYVKQQIAKNPSYYEEEIPTFSCPRYDSAVTSDDFTKNVNDEYYNKFINEDEDFIQLFNSLHPIYYIEK